MTAQTMPLNPTTRRMAHRHRASHAALIAFTKRGHQDNRPTHTLGRPVTAQWPGRSMTLLVLLSTMCGGLLNALMAAETWNPFEHPATIIHQVDGLTHPRDQLMIASEFAGRIATITVDAGDQISGQTAEATDELLPVVQIDDTLAAIAATRAQAALSEARAALTLAEAQRAVRARESAYQDAEHQRISQLVSAGRLTDREGEAQRFTADNARLLLAAQDAQVTAAAAMLASAEQAAADAAERVRRHQLYAPTGWQVSERLVEPLTVVAPGEPILLLSDVRQLEVRVHLTEAEIQALLRQSDIHLRFTDFDQTVPARLDDIDVRANPNTRKRLVTLLVNGAEAPARSGGLAVELAIEVPLSDGSVVLPSKFLIRNQQQMLVELANGNRVAVVPLRERDGYVLIDGQSLPDNAELVNPN